MNEIDKNPDIILVMRLLLLVDTPCKTLQVIFNRGVSGSATQNLFFMHHASSHWDDVCGWAERTVHDTVLELKTICCIRDSIYMQAIVQVLDY